MFVLFLLGGKGRRDTIVTFQDNETRINEKKVGKLGDLFPSFFLIKEAIDL